MSHSLRFPQQFKKYTLHEEKAKCVDDDVPTPIPATVQQNTRSTEKVKCVDDDVPTSVKNSASSDAGDQVEKLTRAPILPKQIMVSNS